jgi:hypothetical protein
MWYSMKTFFPSPHSTLMQERVFVLRFLCCPCLFETHLRLGMIILTILMHLLLTTIHHMTLLRRCRPISGLLEFFPVENSVISCSHESLAPPAYAQIPGAIFLRHLVAYLPRIRRRARPWLSPPRRRGLTPQQTSRACHLARPQPHLPAQHHLRPRGRHPPARSGQPTTRQRPCLRCMGGQPGLHRIRCARADSLRPLLRHRLDLLRRRRLDLLRRPGSPRLSARPHVCNMGSGSPKCTQTALYGMEM